MTIAEFILAVKQLQNYANHEAQNQPSTFAVFLMLTNNNEGGMFQPYCLGYREGDLLANALSAWATYPNEITAYLDSECL